MESAPWRPLFEEHVQAAGSPLLSLATASKDIKGNPFPRVRTCVLRGFFAGLQLHPNAKHDLKLAAGRSVKEESDDEDASYLNPRKYESDLLSITTDARSEKVKHILSGNEVGGPVECLFWSPKAFAQWRIKGKAYVVGGSCSDTMELKARQEVEQYLRLREDTDKPWSWEKEMTTQFANLSPGMRDTFRQALPGSPKSGPAPELQNGGKGLVDLTDPVARKNFRVVVIKPEEVEYIHDEGPGNIRNERFRWKLVPSDSQYTWHWEEEQLWP
ncbi:hypothetical protein TMEN_5929 [Trichophyton mentagrophytes]|uniref:Zn 2cys6 transcription factor protein n=2 Tax=Trichophyton interdigitale TaxID=101480 RepID=A0A9P5CW85_9EURO|nr:hypothetical protein H101_06448 [Trichophyton interdigitale H6]KAF3897141.1 Zn 2cys6 transcription factor protein [Trichophyton interdigitale]KDB20763.1 hypothetical protein H109_07289 [Trichophyton interdigitale MR816]GBF63305.1 hypothetical protein TMEN_5929 [Trichophyton mentagrophytes]KAG5210838.1 Zn 2cys6 transcription factor protein [Trichophyton interdigitale]